MAKKKTAVQESPVVDDGARYHSLFKPTWRPEIDCGEHESFDAAVQFIHKAIDQHIQTYYYLAWEEDDDGNWSAAGHDGVEETNMPFAYITRVAAE